MKKVVVRYEKNPFLEKLVIKTKDKRISVMGVNDNVVMNTLTGEISATQIVAYKKVDATKFVKLFSENIGLLFDLSSAGNKVFGLLITELQGGIDNDIIILDKYTLEKWNKQNPKRTFGEALFNKGKNELVKAQIIASTLRKGEYYINPNFVFNGNRIAFTNLIELQNEPSLFDEL